MTTRRAAVPVPIPFSANDKQGAALSAPVLAATTRTHAIAESCASMERAFLFKPNLRIGLGSLSPLEAYQP